MLKIVMSNSTEVKFDEDEYTDYLYDGKFFIVKRYEKRIAMYNADYIIAVVHSK